MNHWTGTSEFFLGAHLFLKHSTICWCTALEWNTPGPCEGNVSARCRDKPTPVTECAGWQCWHTVWWQLLKGPSPGARTVCVSPAGPRSPRQWPWPPSASPPRRWRRRGPGPWWWCRPGSPWWWCCRWPACRPGRCSPATHTALLSHGRVSLLLQAQPSFPLPHCWHLTVHDLSETLTSLQKTTWLPAAERGCKLNPRAYSSTLISVSQITAS